MKEKLYYEYLNVNNIDNIIELFHDTLIDTNRSFNFFVDWDKIKKNAEKFKIELNIFNSLIGSKNFNQDLKNILSNYPNVIPVIPLLLAIRDTKLKIIKDFSEKNYEIIEYNFENQNLKDNKIEKLIVFFEKTGLKHFFLNLSSKSIYDYLIGIEVGMDTHARIDGQHITQNIEETLRHK